MSSVDVALLCVAVQCLTCEAIHPSRWPRCLPVGDIERKAVERRSMH